MRTLLPLLFIAVLFATAMTTPAPKINKVTPILIVDAIEPALPFWEQLGFQKVAEVPHEAKLGFVILTSGQNEIMYQTRASIRADAGNSYPLEGTATLFLEVESLAAIEAKLKEAPVVVAKRKTFYGATEIFVKEPGGHVIGFAEFEKK